MRACCAPRRVPEVPFGAHIITAPSASRAAGVALMRTTIGSGGKEPIFGDLGHWNQLKRSALPTLRAGQGWHPAGPPSTFVGHDSRMARAGRES